MTGMVAETYDLRALLDSWEQTLRAVSHARHASVTPAQWEAPTECPGWTTGDIVRHLAWIEAFLAGRRDPEHEVEWSRFPHVSDDFARMTETGVDVRRALTQVEACDELDALVDVRLSQIMALDGLSLQSEVMGVFGSLVPLERLLRVRIFDSWTHLQDVRRAVGHPGDLATPGAQVSALQMARTTSYVLARAIEAPAGHDLARARRPGRSRSSAGPVSTTTCAGIDIDEVSRPESRDDLARHRLGDLRAARCRTARRDEPRRPRPRSGVGPAGAGGSHPRVARDHAVVAGAASGVVTRCSRRHPFPVVAISPRRGGPACGRSCGCRRASRRRRAATRTTASPTTTWRGTST